MPDSIPLTPEAAAVVAAFDSVMDRAGVFEGATDALAAALRELANQVVPAIDTPPLMRGPALREIDEIRREILAIADSIENAIAYAENHPDA